MVDQGNGITETSPTEVGHRQSGWWDFLKVRMLGWWDFLKVRMLEVRRQ